MVRWLLAKYVPDIGRNEPRNVGLILLRGDEVAMRFVGQQPDGSIDGRSARVVRSASVYKGWVEYWRRLGVRGVDALMEAAGREQLAQNYRLTVGGAIEAGHDPTMPTDFLLDHLYERYVGPIPLGRDERVTAGGRTFEELVRLMARTPPIKKPPTADS